MTKEFNKEIVKAVGNVKLYHIFGTKENGETYDFKQVVLEKVFFDKSIGRKVVNETSFSEQDLKGLTAMQQTL